MHSWSQFEFVERTMSVKHPGTFEPEVLARLGAIFDEAWASLAAGFEHANESTRLAARAKLAGILLELVEQQLISESLKQRALMIFQSGGGLPGTREHSASGANGADYSRTDPAPN
jgi:hypothetical protein